MSLAQELETAGEAADEVKRCWAVLSRHASQCRPIGADKGKSCAAALIALSDPSDQVFRSKLNTALSYCCEEAQDLVLEYSAAVYTLGEALKRRRWLR